MTTANIEDGRLPGRGLDTLAAVAAHIAYRAVRNRGTIGGSLCHADPAADWVSTLCALGAECHDRGPERQAPPAGRSVHHRRLRKRPRRRRNAGSDPRAAAVGARPLRLLQSLPQGWRIRLGHRRGPERSRSRGNFAPSSGRQKDGRLSSRTRASFGAPTDVSTRRLSCACSTNTASPIASTRRQQVAALTRAYDQASSHEHGPTHRQWALDLADVEPRLHLADFLREHLNLTATHLRCEQGACGACTVLIDGQPARSCITYAAMCDGAAITTIEGLEDDPVMVALRRAFSEEHGLQCGYCTPGMLVTARDIVIRLPDADQARIRTELSGNLCRCTGYVGIVRAISRVLDERRRGEMADAKCERARSAQSGRAALSPPTSRESLARCSAGVRYRQCTRGRNGVWSWRPPAERGDPAILCGVASARGGLGILRRHCACRTVPAGRAPNAATRR